MARISCRRSRSTSGRTELRGRARLALAVLDADGVGLGGRKRKLNDPTEPLAHGAMILFSAALLLTPGFFTDAVGFLLLVPGPIKTSYRNTEFAHHTRRDP